MICLLIAFLFVTTGVLPAMADNLDWTTFRHDSQRTGRSPGVGAIRNPGILWRFPIGGRRALVELSPQSGKGSATVPFSQDLNPLEFEATLQACDGSYRTLDLAGDGKLVRVHDGSNVRYARFLPEARGYQKFVMQDGMAIKGQPGGPGRPVANGFLYRYDHGHEELVWKTEPEEQCEGPLCAVADMDDDGKLEVAVSTWYRVMVFDGATGKKKMECRWHNGRNYGYFQVAKLDNTPYPKCVVLADFMVHLDVLDNDGKHLSLKWRKEIDFKLFQKRKAVRIGPHPLMSFRGNGEREIAINVYNDTGDEQWHAVVLDGLTGDKVVDLPGRYIHGTADLKGDGHAELLLSEAKGLSTPFVGRLFVGGWGKDRLVEEPLPYPGRWLTYQETTLPMTQASIAADGATTALVTDMNSDGRGEAWIVTRGARGVGEQLVALKRGPDRAWGEVARCAVPPRVHVSVAGVKRVKEGLPTSLLLKLEKPSARDDQLQLLGVKATVRSVGSLKLPPDVPIVGRRRPKDSPTVFVAAAGEVVALSPPKKPGDSPRELWRVPGRSATTEAAQFYGLEMADLNGDGNNEVLVADHVDTGQAALVAYDAAGKVLWRHIFQRFPGSDPVWNTGGLLLWATRHFTKAGKNDVYVCLRRSAMHSDESCVLDGATGREIWWQDNLQERGCGGVPVASLDLSDGRQDLLGQYPDIHYRLSGQTGKPVSLWQFPHQELGGWSAYAMPVIGPFGSKGETEVLMGRCSYSLALWTLDGKMLWHTPYLDGTTTAPALASVSGQGRLDIGAVGYRGGFRCYDPSTGSVRWTFPTRAVPSDPVAADIDGDGREEFLMTAGKELLALGEAEGKPRLVWKLDLPAPAHSPIVADVNGDGRLEILFTAEDGYLYCVGQASGTDPRLNEMR